MKTLLTPLAALALAASLAGAATAAPVVPGFSVTMYATAPAPVRLTFDPTGAMYVGNGSNSPTGAPISRVAVGGGVATPYGPAIFDPDAVLFDALGTVSGVPGAVLVGGASLAGAAAEITVIRPDQTAFSLFGPSTALRNPDDLAFDNSGRLLGTDFGDGDPSRRTVYATTGGAPSLLFVEGGGAAPGSLAIDASNRIITSASDGTLRIHDAAGNLVNGAFVTGLGNFPAIGFGLGGAFGLNLYALDYVAGTLLRIDGAGNTTVVGSGFSPDSYEMAFGPDGAMYVTQFDQNTVLRIAAVPEPGRLLLMALGGAALLLRVPMRTRRPR